MPSTRMTLPIGLGGTRRTQRPGPEVNFYRIAIHFTFSGLAEFSVAARQQPMTWLHSCLCSSRRKCLTG